MVTSTELFVRNDGPALLVVGVDEQLTDEDDVAKLRAASAALSSRQRLTVILKLDVNYPETRSLAVFDEGRLVGEVAETFGKDMDFRLTAWRAGDDGAWREWEAGCEPVLRPQKKRSCGGCDVHGAIEF